jgi:serpin B
MFRLTAVLALAAVAVPARAGEPDVGALVKGNNAFALDLYQQLRAQDGNLFLSPYSISAALAMTSAGARGDTLAEMEKALRFPAQEKLRPAFADLIKQINGDPKAKRAYELRTANKLWGQKNYDFNADFLKTTADTYGAGLEVVDFIGATEAARKTINGWVEKETNDKIKDLLKPGILTVDTRLVLTNAIYFKGDWQFQFKKDKTERGTFHLNDRKTVEAPLMHQAANVKYYRDGNLGAVELPYSGKALSMVVLVPNEVNGLAVMEKGLTAERLAVILGAMVEHKALPITLPKFKTTAEFSLRENLEALGMKRAFIPGIADLSGIGGSPGRLSISAVIHKAFVDVNEEGTEAAAATAVVVEDPSARPELTADHPFVFLIRDTRSGAVLFLGRIVDPTR